jgi:TetR/AcrR family transcriptional regulator
LFDRRRQHELKREVLLSEAAGIFQQRGYAHTSLDDIATHLGITRAALYHYFNNKQQILYECFVLSYDVTDEIFASALRDGHSARERLELYFRRYIVAGITTPKRMLPARDMVALTDDMREELNKRRLARRNRLRQLVVDGIAEGNLRQCDPKIVVSTWAGAAAWLVDTYSPDGETPPDAIADEVVRVFLTGLAATGGDAHQTREADGGAR